MPNTSSLPDPVVSCLDLGKQSHERPFSAADEWCNKCSVWKPPMAHHCRQCARCSTWMDHHCNFVGTCIGFRNTRCYIVFLMYGHVYLPLLALLTCWYLFHHPPHGHWDVLYWIVFTLLVVVYNSMNIRGQFMMIRDTILAGWTHGVLRQKFEALLKEAKDLESQCSGQLTAGTDESMLRSQNAVRNLYKARQALYLEFRKKEHDARGVFWFTGNALLDSPGTQRLFGGKPSWRWLLPLVPGGDGDPFVLPFCDWQSCKDWVAFGEAREACEKTIVAMRAAEAEWKNRMDQMLANTS